MQVQYLKWVLTRLVWIQIMFCVVLCRVARWHSPGLPDVADTSNFITAVNVDWMVQISALSLSKYWNKNTKASILVSMMPCIKIYDHRAFIRFSSNQTMVGKFFIICENYFVHVLHFLETFYCFLDALKSAKFCQMRRYDHTWPCRYHNQFFINWIFQGFSYSIVNVLLQWPIL